MTRAWIEVKIIQLRLTLFYHVVNMKKSTKYKSLQYIEILLRKCFICHVVFFPVCDCRKKRRHSSSRMRARCNNGCEASALLLLTKYHRPPSLSLLPTKQNSKQLKFEWQSLSCGCKHYWIRDLFLTIRMILNLGEISQNIPVRFGLQRSFPPLLWWHK